MQMLDLSAAIGSCWHQSPVLIEIACAGIFHAQKCCASVEDAVS